MASDPMFTSPKRHTGFYLDPEMIHGSPPIKDVSMYPWNWGSGAQGITFSPETCASASADANNRLKRGRPRADRISSLIQQGSQTEEGIRCKICSRTFPREKSLQAHMRTHTGERPYLCDYPGCSKAFCQSGQLKTHQRLHTGEKPFVCSAPGCESRFTHANRHCPSHPLASLKRDAAAEFTPPTNKPCQTSPQVAQWLHRFAQQRDRTTPHKASLKRPVDQDVENRNGQPQVKRRLARKRLISTQEGEPQTEEPVRLCNLDQNTLLPPPPPPPSPVRVPCTTGMNQEPEQTVPMNLTKLTTVAKPPQNSTTETVATGVMDFDGSDHHERMLGALALMQLACGKPS